MKNTTIKSLVCAAMALGLAATVQASMVNGTIGFDGTVTLDTTSAATATAVETWAGSFHTGLPYVGGASGDFLSYVTPNQGVTFTAPWSFNTTTPINLWSVGGFTFQLTSSAITSQGGTPGVNGSVSVSGVGTITGNSFDATPGIWTFTTQDPPAGSTGVTSYFTFSASSAAPDGGMTAIMLGAGLSVLGLIRRKLA